MDRHIGIGWGEALHALAGGNQADELIRRAPQRSRMSTAATAEPPVASIGSSTRQTSTVGLTGRRE